MGEAAQTDADFGRAVPDRVSGASSQLNTVRPSAFDRHDFDFDRFGSTKVRMALASGGMRVLDHLREEASVFARIGLDNRLRSATRSMKGDCIAIRIAGDEEP